MTDVALPIDNISLLILPLLHILQPLLSPLYPVKSAPNLTHSLVNPLIMSDSDKTVNSSCIWTNMYISQMTNTFF